MSLVTMQALLADAEKGGYALGGFVTTDLMVTQSLIQASEEMGAPLILMIPWGTTLDKHRPDEYLRLTVEMARSANVPVAVHLDHGASYEECIKAINAGFTSVMFDGSSLPMEENIAITKKVVEAAHACGITVEAEIGHVGGRRRPRGGRELLHDGGRSGRFRGADRRGLPRRCHWNGAWNLQGYS